jgi:phenyl-phosphate phosphatase/carboxylase subunit beta
MIRDLRDFIAACDRRGLLHRITAEVDWNLELSHIAKINEEQGGPALLFENVRDSDVPVLTSAFTTRERLAICLEQDTDLSMSRLSRRWMELTRGDLVPPTVVNEAPATENAVTGDAIDITRFPAPFYYPEDGGRYIGTAVYLVCCDPDTGWTNLGTYRMQVQGKDRVSVMILPGKQAEFIFNKYKARGEKMPAAAVIGCDPVLLLASSTFVSAGTSEYDIAGALRQDPVRVFESDLTGLMLPASAEIILEGYLDPDDMCEEGPFGEYTGYYSSAKDRKGAGLEPCLRIERVLHRDKPVFWATTVGKPINDIHMFQSLNRTATLWHDLDAMRIPGIEGVYVPPESCGWFWAIISVRQMYPGHSSQVGNAAIATTTGHYALKGVIVVDHDIAVEDWDRVMWALSVRFDPRRSAQIIDRGRSSPVDPSLTREGRLIMSRIILDACTPYEWTEKPREVFMDADTLRQVARRWSEYGFTGASPADAMIDRLTSR